MKRDFRVFAFVKKIVDWQDYVDSGISSINAMLTTCEEPWAVTMNDGNVVNFQQETNSSLENTSFATKKHCNSEKSERQ